MLVGTAGLSTMLMMAGAYLMGGGHTITGLVVATIGALILGAIVAAMEQRYSTLVGSTRDGRLTVRDMSYYLLNRSFEGTIDAEALGDLPIFVSTPKIMPVTRVYTARFDDRHVLFLDTAVDGGTDGQSAG